MADLLQQEAEAAYTQLRAMSERATQLLGNPSLTAEDIQAITILRTQVDQAKVVAHGAALRREIAGLTRRIQELQAEKQALQAQLAAL